MNKKNVDLNNEDLLSKTIQFLRFPLIIGVVLIHSRVPYEWMSKVTENPTFDFPIYSTISYLFSSIIARISVPLFFFFSGFLFFYRTSFNFSVYIKKIKKRGRTLLIPFLLWNFIAVALTFVLHTFFPNITIDDSTRNQSLLDLLLTFWNYHSGAPTNYPLWFIRDLIVVMLFSPLVYLLIRYCRQYGLLVLGVLWLFGWWIKEPGFSIMALFFFSMGGVFSIHQKNFVEIFLSFFRFAIVIYVTSIILQMYFRNNTISSYISKINILSGIVLTIDITAFFLSKGIWKVNSFLSEASFFIYVYHGLIVDRITSRAFMILPHTDIALVFIYLMCPIVILGIGLPLYYCLKKRLPRTTALLMGGR